MSKFKVGDRVKYKSRHESGTILEINNLGVIFECDNPEDGTTISQYRGKRVLWPSENSIELIAPASYELHITCNDGKTINAAYKVNGKIEKRTEAVCAPSDAFDFATGAQTAFDRVFPKAAPTQPIAPQEDKPKYKSGDIVKIIANTCDHGHDIGAIVALEEMGSFRWADKKNSPAWGIVGSAYFVNERDIEPYAESEQPKLTVTRKMLEKLGACTGGISTFDKLFPSGTGDLKGVCEQAEKCGHADYSSWLTSRKDRIGEMQNEKEPEPVYFSGKVVCTATDGDGTFTVGKVYEFIDGQVLDNKSYKRPTGMKMKSLNDAYLANWYYRFIPYIGEA